MSKSWEQIAQEQSITLLKQQQIISTYETKNMDLRRELQALKDEVKKLRQRVSLTRICSVCGNVCV